MSHNKTCSNVREMETTRERQILASRVLETRFLAKGLGSRKQREQHKIASLFSTVSVLLKS